MHNGNTKTTLPLLKPRILRILCGVVFVAVLLIAARDLQAGERRVLSWGDRGSDVAQVQRKLKQYNLYEGQVTGYYDRDTVQSVRRFQGRNKIAARGVLDEKTHLLLFKPVAEDIPREDVFLLSAIIESEAANEPYLGRVAVGAVIVNRIDSASFPNTLGGVIFQPGAFESVWNGQFGREISADSRRAARDAWSGQDPTGNALYFWNPAKPVNPWVWQRQQVAQIGRHVFAR
ncbi:cell wall hydrolase [Desulfoscipio gibsoniae]|uniref:Putative peptidoglycan binding protein n=1 Tax=Desulfoscipio gibsoniae DSM 7213 TaxID=767817 RepID=R4KTW0_9FIRM|nr:cell wall hydrolase [Desulfoscipio gibsoniae]AGL03031.1 putative peptidoglycan binding protein [Desulfoscipio gibsoniae DSM 7213]